MALKIRYNLGDHGWADVNLAVGMNRCNTTVSYLHDTLADLISAANLLLKGSPEAKVLLMDEPGQHMIHLQSLGKDKLSLEVRWFKDWASWDLITDKEFEIVFSAEDTILHFSTQIFENASRLLNDHGTGGYKEKWIAHDFPIDEYNRLKALLKK